MSPDPPGLVTPADPSGPPESAADQRVEPPLEEPADTDDIERIDALFTRPPPAADTEPVAAVPPVVLGGQRPPFDQWATEREGRPDRPSWLRGTTSPRPAKARHRARRVVRVIRRIDLWSVLKLALVLYTCLYVATLAALAAIWGVAYSTGLIGKLQSFLGDVGLDNFRFYGDQMFRACAAIGAVLVLAGTLITVLTVALINLISELTGGIRIVVIEEEPLPSEREQVAAAGGQPLPSDPAAGL